MTIGQLLDAVDSKEIAEWIAYFKVEDDLREKPLQQSPEVLKAKFRAMAPVGDSLGKSKGNG